MKKIFFSSYLLLSICFLVSCSKEEPQPKNFAVNGKVIAVNVEINGIPIKMEANKDKWTSRTSSWLDRYDTNPYVSHTVMLNKHGGEFGGTYNQFSFHIYTPKIYIKDTTNTIESYNKRIFLQHFEKNSNLPLSSFKNREGYRFFANFIDETEKTTSFGASTEEVPTQEGSTLKIIKSEVLENNYLCVTYEIDCNMYYYDGKPPKISKIIGTIQAIYYYRPL